MQGTDKRKALGALAAVLVFLVLTPNFVTTVQDRWQAYVNPPPPFTYDLKVAIPQSSGLIVIYLPDYQKAKYPGLPAIYEILESVPSPQKAELSISPETEEITLGGNVTFVVKTRGDTDLDLYIFLTDPRGIVRGAYPDGQIPGVVAQPYPRVSEDERNAMNRGTLAFTFRIPQDALSPGKWTMFALATDSFPGAPRSFIAWNAATFSAVEPSIDQPDFALVFIGDLLRSLGILVIVYRIVCVSFEPLAVVLKALWGDRYFIAGLVIIAIYLVLTYLV